MTIRVDDTGAYASGLAEALSETQQQLRDIFGDDLALDAQTPQGQIAGLIALLKAEVGEAIVDLADGVSPDSARGVKLRILGRLLHIDFGDASRSQVTATLTGVEATNVPVGSRARTTDGDEFRTLAAVNLTPAGVTVDMEAVNAGAVEAAAGTLTRIVTVVPGWETITNAEAAVIGREAQTEAQYRGTFEVRTARNARSSLAALDAALADLRAGRFKTTENRTGVVEVQKQWPIEPHGILAVVEAGTASDITRAVETHRGQGTPTVAGIVGGTPNEGTLNAVRNETVRWNGVDYAGLDLTGAGTPAAKAAALTALLAPARVQVAAIDGIYVATYVWKPGDHPVFAAGNAVDAFGLNEAKAAYPEGPFVRPRDRTLVVTIDVTRLPGFPSDGLQTIRNAINAVIDGYEIGQQVWQNDLLRVVESVGNARVTSLTVQHGNADVSGVDVPFDSLWKLAAADLTINITS